MNVQKEAENYYRNVQGYHQLVEDRQEESFVVPPELLLRFIDVNGVTVDVAGGSGINAQTLGLQSSKYVCVDFSLHGLSIAAEHQRGMCVQADVSSLPVKDEKVQTVLCSWSLEHVADPMRAIEEMMRIVKPGGRVMMWGPNWDNIFRKDFPQYVHKDRAYIRRVRRQIFLRMIKNEFLPFQYDPYINSDVAAFAEPGKYMSGDTDAIHCVLCQETVKFMKMKGMRIVHISDFSEMGKHLRNDFVIRLIRAILTPLLPLLRCVPLVRWFVIRFPLVVEKPV